MKDLEPIIHTIERLEHNLYIMGGKRFRENFESSVTSLIGELGSITYIQGHSKELDELKDRVWRLINL